MSKKFTFSQKAAELEFVDDGRGGDGKVYAVLSGDDLSPHDALHMLQVQNRVHQLTVNVTNASEDDLYQMSGGMLEILDELFALVVPTLPEARRRAVPFPYVMDFIQWWNGQGNEPQTNGNGSKAKRTRSHSK